MANELTNEQKEFYGGVLAALALVAAHGQETLFREIVASVGPSGLIAVATDPQYGDDIDRESLRQYGYL